LKSIRFPLPFAGLLLLGLLLRIYLAVAIHYTVDDALITFRYVENLAAGKGFVYNEGERVLGTTTPLFTVLLFLFRKIGISPFGSAVAISTTADLFSAWILFRFFRNSVPPFNYLPAAVFFLSPETLQWTLSGMETQLLVCFIFAAFLFFAAGRWTLAFTFGSLCCLTRIDGVSIPATILLCYWIRYRKIPIKPLLTGLVLLLPWIVFAQSYFGSVIPNSAEAKWALSGSNLLQAISQILIRGFLHLHSFGLPLFLLAVVGCWEIIHRRREELVIVIWTLAYAFSYTLAAGPMHPWYYAPFYAGYLVLIFRGLVAGITRVHVFYRPSWVLNGVGAATIIIVLLLSYARVFRLRSDQAHMNAINRAVGTWVAENTPPASVLAVKDVGYIGYYSGRTILDLGGLVSPQCIPFRAKGDFLGAIRRFRPQYFAFSEGQVRALNLDRSDLMRSYKPVKMIQNQYGVYIIYQSI
jgi:hypothetical protein